MDLAKGGNQEHEAEVKAKDDQWDKKITMYLEKGTEKGNDPVCMRKWMYFPYIENRTMVCKEFKFSGEIQR